MEQSYVQKSYPYFCLSQTFYRKRIIDFISKFPCILDRCESLIVWKTVVLCYRLVHVNWWLQLPLVYFVNLSFDVL